MTYNTATAALETLFHDYTAASSRYHFAIWANAKAPNTANHNAVYSANQRWDSAMHSLREALIITARHEYDKALKRWQLLLIKDTINAARFAKGLAPISNYISLSE